MRRTMLAAGWVVLVGSALLTIGGPPGTAFAQSAPDAGAGPVCMTFRHGVGVTSHPCELRRVPDPPNSYPRAHQYEIRSTTGPLVRARFVVETDFSTGRIDGYIGRVQVGDGRCGWSSERTAKMTLVRTLVAIDGGPLAEVHGTIDDALGDGAPAGCPNVDVHISF